MIEIGRKVKIHRSGVCSKHKGQEGTIIRSSGSDPRTSYFIQFDDGKIEIHREKSFESIN